MGEIDPERSVRDVAPVGVFALEVAQEYPEEAKDQQIDREGKAGCCQNLGVAIYGIGADLQAQGIENEHHDLGTALEETQVQVHPVADESRDKISPGMRFEPLENFSALVHQPAQGDKDPVPDQHPIGRK